MKDIYHSKSKIDGMGVHAGEDIKKGEIIQYVKGKVKFFVPKNKKESAAYPDWLGSCCWIAGPFQGW